MKLSTLFEELEPDLDQRRKRLDLFMDTILKSTFKVKLMDGKSTINLKPTGVYIRHNFSGNRFHPCVMFNTDRVIPDDVLDKEVDRIQKYFKLNFKHSYINTNMKSVEDEIESYKFTSNPIYLRLPNGTVTGSPSTILTDHSLFK